MSCSTFSCSRRRSWSACEYPASPSPGREGHGPLAALRLTSVVVFVRRLIISSILQFCTIALSTGCPCWDSGGLKRAVKSENMFQLQRDDDEQAGKKAKRDQEAASWVEKKRREARP